MSTETWTFETLQQLRDGLSSLPDGAVIVDRDGDMVPASDLRHMSGSYAPYTVTYEVPAPLDPSKVKAGDTVTILGDTAKVEGKVHAVFMEDALVFEIGYSHFKVSGDDCWTLTDHQPAPKPEWEPGTVGTATVRGVEDVKVMRTDGDGETDMLWVSAQHVGSARGHLAYQVTDFVPDQTRPAFVLPTRVQIFDILYPDGIIPAEDQKNSKIDALRDLFGGESR